jgi:hypothetical protein
MVACFRVALLLLPPIVALAPACTRSSNSPRRQDVGQTCFTNEDCASGSCLLTPITSVCTTPCQDNAGCGNGTVCGVLADGSKTCLPGCGRFLVDTTFTCENGVPTACAVASPASCADCGCPAAMRCTPGVGCGPLATVGETCLFDEDCNTNNCSPIFRLCRTPVGQPCTVFNCDLCLSTSNGWSYCSRECNYETDCNGGRCVGNSNTRYYTCQFICQGDSDPDCPGTCVQISGTQTRTCDCANCSRDQPKRAVGQPCRTAGQCLDGECHVPPTSACTLYEGCGTCTKTCADDAACGSGLACAQVSCASGQTAGCGNKCLRTCGPNMPCAAGTCRALAGATGSTVSVCDKRSVDGGPCSAAGDCQSGRCVVGACVPPSGAPNGGSCNLPADCQSASCVDGRCRGSGLIGDPCTVPADCIVGMCCTTFCATSC